MGYALKVRELLYEQTGKERSLEKVKWDRKHDLCGGILFGRSGEPMDERASKRCPET